MTAEPTIWLEAAQIAQYENIVLSNVELTVLPGEFVYLIGKTGSGKSSLLKVLYGDLPVHEGLGKVCDYDLNKIKSKNIPFLRRKLGIVFQDFELLTDRSVDQNLTFVLKATGWKDKKSMEARMKDVLSKVGLENKGYKKPHELSGGEQQRVAIARALLNDPELILADEPTGNLDPETSIEIIKLLIDISKNGKTVLMATHDHVLMQQFPSRTIRCEGGQLLDLLPSQSEL